jgi:hypothetical protein
VSLKLPQGRVSSRGIQNPRALVVECIEGFEVQERLVFHDKDKVRGLLIVTCHLPNGSGLLPACDRGASTPTQRGSVSSASGAVRVQTTPVVA